MLRSVSQYNTVFTRDSRSTETRFDVSIDLFTQPCLSLGFCVNLLAAFMYPEEEGVYLIKCSCYRFLCERDAVFTTARAEEEAAAAADQHVKKS